jgi:hypothetical protein
LTRWLPVDLILVVGLAGAAWLLANGATFDGSILRAALGIPLVLLLPGYALAAAIFPMRPPHRTEQVLLCLGLSLAAAALGGLVLHLTPWGIQAGSWATLLFGVTFISSVVASLRRRPIPRPRSRPAASTSLVPAATFLLSGLVVAGAIWIARMPSAQQADQAYSVLWAVPAAGDPANRIRLGISSGEAASTGYIVRVVAGTQTVQEFSLEVAPTGTWETEVQLPDRSGDETVEVLLFRAAAPQDVYRRTALRARG